MHCHALDSEQRRTSPPRWYLSLPHALPTACTNCFPYTTCHSLGSPILHTSRYLAEPLSISLIYFISKQSLLLPMTWIKATSKSFLSFSLQMYPSWLILCQQLIWVSWNITFTNLKVCWRADWLVHSDVFMKYSQVHTHFYSFLDYLSLWASRGQGLACWPWFWGKANWEPLHSTAYKIMCTRGY